MRPPARHGSNSTYPTKLTIDLNPPLPSATTQPRTFPPPYVDTLIPRILWRPTSMEECV
ncbi:hypothetical protein BGZ63DRAFT_380021 [Mariannaea sp. PMI_226]|nr:hypothetical protein BGZ63DRAFT_380021 [Mariannaea sp. PMI_226]